MLTHDPYNAMHIFTITFDLATFHVCQLYSPKKIFHRWLALQSPISHYILTVQAIPGLLIGLLRNYVLKHLHNVSSALYNLLFLIINIYYILTRKQSNFFMHVSCMHHLVKLLITSASCQNASQLSMTGLFHSHYVHSSNFQSSQSQISFLICSS